MKPVLIVPGKSSGKKSASPVGLEASDLAFMDQALELAAAAELAGEVPIGALVVNAQGEVMGRGYNRTRLDADPTAHAEMVALREAGWRMANPRLNGCTLYATIEPCAMCAGALIQARIARLVYGASDPKSGALHSAPSLAAHPALNHEFTVIAGVRAQACGARLSEFFRRCRARQASPPEPAATD